MTPDDKKFVAECEAKAGWDHTGRLCEIIRELEASQEFLAGEVQEWKADYEKLEAENARLEELTNHIGEHGCQVDKFKAELKAARDALDKIGDDHYNKIADSAVFRIDESGLLKDYEDK